MQVWCTYSPLTNNFHNQLHFLTFPLTNMKWEMKHTLVVTANFVLVDTHTHVGLWQRDL